MPGHKRIPASDPEEQRLREAWYAAQGAERTIVGKQLSDYLWNRTLVAVEEDHKRHPKKKRNQPKPVDIEVRPGGRFLP